MSKAFNVKMALKRGRGHKIDKKSVGGRIGLCDGWKEIFNTSLTFSYVMLVIGDLGEDSSCVQRNLIFLMWRSVSLVKRVLLGTHRTNLDGLGLSGDGASCQELLIL
jgi:hypothetical protein